ncbi:MAG: rRNA adenine N-6-methyltransferase family protein, partial [Nitrosopumilus sp.]
SAASDVYKRQVSVIANYCMEINQIKKVGKENFTPPPKVDSVILKIRKIKNLDLQTIQTINKIFSFRRKTVKNILNQFGKNSDDSRRIDELKGEDIVGLAKQIIQK